MTRYIHHIATALAAGTTALIVAATPAFAFDCGNISRNPDAGLGEFKDAGALAETTASPTSRAWNATGTGAFADASVFGGPEGYVIFARNLLDQAAAAGTPDHGVVEVIAE